MNDMFLPPPGLTAQMPLDPSLLFLQKRSGAPTPEELASMSSVGTQILQPQDTIGSAIDPYPLVGASFLLSGASGPVPAPSPPKPDDGLIGPKGPVGVISEASSTGRGNKWFDGFMVVAFLVNIMACVRISMLTKLVDGMSVIKSMNMNMELARQMYDVQVAIGEMKKQMALNEAASLIASAVMMFASAAFSGIAHGISVAKYKKPDAPGGEGVGSTSGNKKAPGAADDLDEAGMTSTAKEPLPGGINNPAYQANGPKATFEPESPAQPPDLTDPKLGKNKTANQSTQKMGDNLRNSDTSAAEAAASKRQANNPSDIELDLTPNTASGQKSQQIKMEDAGLDTNKRKVDNDFQPPSPGSERASKEAQEAYDKKVSETRSNRANFHNKYVTTMASPFFQGMQNIAQAVAKIVNAKLEGEMGKLQAIMEMLHGWQKNAQQVGASAQEDYKANQDEVDKLLSSLQKLIDENFKAFNINPKG